jgi:hypothetical protein
LDIPKKETWQERVQKVYKYHQAKVKENKKWTIRDTANSLKRSIGSVSQDVNLYYYLRAYSQLETIPTYVQAVEWMRNKKSVVRAK